MDPGRSNLRSAPIPGFTPVIIFKICDAPAITVLMSSLKRDVSTSECHWSQEIEVQSNLLLHASDAIKVLW